MLIFHFDQKLNIGGYRFLSYEKTHFIQKKYFYAAISSNIAVQRHIFLAVRCKIS